MKTTKLLVLIMLSSIMSQAQAVKIKWKQIANGTTGQVAVVGVDGNGTWVTPPFLNLSDTSAMLSSYGTAINERVKYTDTAAMLSALWSGIGTKANDNEVVKITGPQTIYGEKTYSNPLAVGPPTLPEHATTKLYVDTKVADYIPLSQKAAVGGVATLGADGKVPSGQLPAFHITQTYVVATEGAMLALSAVSGDIAVRTDENKSYILVIEPASTLGNWQELLTPGITNTDQVSEGSTNLYFTTSRARGAISSSGDVTYSNSTGVIGVVNKLNGQMPSYYLSRTNHTGSQAISTITNLQTSLNAKLDSSDIRIKRGDTAYSWGNHATEGYIKVLPVATNSVLGAVKVGSGLTVAVDGTLSVTSTPDPLQDAAEEFTGGTSSTLILSHAPSTASHLWASLNGVVLHASDYSVIGDQFTINTFARESSDFILVYYSYEP